MMKRERKKNKKSQLAAGFKPMTLYPTAVLQPCPMVKWNLKKLLNSIEIEVDGPVRGERNEQCSK